ncbi:MAG: DUF934 domain-containing protein [Pseudomonadota bacterium]
MKLLRLKSGAVVHVEKTARTEITLEAWRERGAPMMKDEILVVAADVDVTTLEPNVHFFKAIAVQFSVFTDGRAFTQARRLRRDVGYAGVIEAHGDIGRDQVFFMARVGITDVCFEDHDTENILGALGEFSDHYQASADQRAPIWLARRARIAAAA